MVENYTKDIKESVYHDAVISILAVGYTMLGKMLKNIRLKKDLGTLIQQCSSIS